MAGARLVRRSLDNAIIVVIVGVLVVTSGYLLIASDSPLTREEAVELSRSSELVREGLAIARGFSIETNYYNASRLEQLRIWHSDKIFENVPKDSFWEAKIPEGHTAWEVIWWFGGTGAPSEGYAVIIIVDASMGTIVHEEKGVHLL